MSGKLTIPADVIESQTRAANPAISAWVSANAGSGKTHVLASRVIRLLLDGNDPQKILCLTYTKAAAANMAHRIFRTLGEWAMAGDTKLADDIRKLTGQTPSPLRLREARKLFARALETPGGLKIQTIHAFCEAILHQFPLEANVAVAFFVPALVYIAGAIGSQAVSVSVRALAEEKIEIGRLLRDEMIIGIGIGLSLGGLAAAGVQLVFGDALLSLAVGLAILSATPDKSFRLAAAPAAESRKRGAEATWLPRSTG